MTIFLLFFFVFIFFFVSHNNNIYKRDVKIKNVIRLSSFFLFLQRHFFGNLNFLSLFFVSIWFESICCLLLRTNFFLFLYLCLDQSKMVRFVYPKMFHIINIIIVFDFSLLIIDTATGNNNNNNNIRCDRFDDMFNDFTMVSSNRRQFPTTIDEFVKYCK